MLYWVLHSFLRASSHPLSGDTTSLCKQSFHSQRNESHHLQSRRFELHLLLRQVGQRSSTSGPIFCRGQGQDCICGWQDNGQRKPQPESGRCGHAAGKWAHPRFQGGGWRVPHWSKRPSKILFSCTKDQRHFFSQSRSSWPTLLRSGAGRGFLCLVYPLSKRHTSWVLVSPTKLLKLSNHVFLALWSKMVWPIAWPHTSCSVLPKKCLKRQKVTSRWFPIVNDANCSPVFTLNMDQTPMWFAMATKGSIKPWGSRIVNIRTARGDGKGVIVAVTITALRHQLSSLIVFKGKPNRRIAKKEVPTLPRDCSTSWMIKHSFMSRSCSIGSRLSSNCMLQLRLKESSLSSSLTCSRCTWWHWLLMLSRCLVSRLSSGGCTRLVQPVDVGYNKAFKAICRATHHELSQWIITVQENISTVTIHNAWKTTGYLYYPEQPWGISVF